MEKMDRVVAKMVETPSPQRMQRFYSALKVTGIGEGLVVRDVGEGKGKGIFASKTFEEGDPVLIEPPLVAAQDTANKVDALVCAHCFQYVGSIELQIGRRLSLNQPQASGRPAETPEAETLDLDKRSGSEASDDEVTGSGQGTNGFGSREVTGSGQGTNGFGSREAIDKVNGLETELDEEGEHYCEVDESDDERIPAPPETVTALLDGTLKLPLSEQIPLPAVVECLGGCSENVYCSDTCASISWEAHHKLLCAGPRSEAADTEALRGFRDFADGSNNIFHAAAQVVAATVLRARKVGAPIIPEHLAGGVGIGSEGRGRRRSSRAVTGGRASEGGDEISDLDALLRAWEPFSMGWKGVWWESVACPPEMEGRPEEEAEFRASIRELCDGSLQLLRAAFGREAETYRPLFSLEVYSRIIGMFELNNLALVVQSPVENYFLAIDELSEDEKRKVEPVTKPLLDALGRSYSAHCEGTAFYMLQSCANHSCAPNARAFKREQDVNGHAVLLANRRIEVGEEVTISYIDESDSYIDRQRALADYGFVCRCLRCLTDSLND
ncbi:hypothetical protein KFL_008230040 [Klebsormidium nitens]|uniref:SET domain-containing protein n=1 Tax=Klebsormidium nitens TaxID=105231 RepID=A0A1Y1IQ79_KLENI|nr:hypothetical protein KFL_008230040 [Klebsormidium nitens]|eukprot:GAQ91639.1 hypothetical protein KFL_008230040 [Klebsormidium nitens]